jgi:hypothetical protein
MLPCPEGSGTLDEGHDSLIFDDRRHGRRVADTRVHQCEEQRCQLTTRPREEAQAPARGVLDRREARQRIGP